MIVLIVIMGVIVGVATGVVWYKELEKMEKKWDEYFGPDYRRCH